MNSGWAKAARWAALSVLVTTGSAVGQMRVVTYNVARLAGDEQALLDVLQFLGADDTPGFAVIPHIFVFQEVNDGDEAVLGQLLPDHVLGSFPAAASVAIFYDPLLLEEVPEEHFSIPTGATRNTERWSFRLVGYESPDASFYIYGSHLKSGGSAKDELERLGGVFLIRYDSDMLPLGTHIIYLGDMNLQSCSEPGYAFFLDKGPGQAIDPVPGCWKGAANAILHTQSPLATGVGLLVGGGMDDRFDFQLMTAPFDDGAGLSLIPGSYRAVGNDGNHFDLAINDGTNTYWPDDLQASGILADALHDASDHVPVAADYRLPGLILATLPQTPRVITGTDLELQLTLANGAPVVVSEGADTIDYSATAAGAIDGALEGTLVPLGPADFASFPIDTTVPAILEGSVTVTSDAQGAGSPVVKNTTISVLRPSNPSLSAVDDVDVAAVPWALQPDTGVRSRQVSLFNHQFEAVQALLDVDAVTGGDFPFGFGGGLVAGIGDAPAQLTFTFDTTGVAIGDYQATYTITTSDEDIPGASVSQVELTLDVTVQEGVAVAINEIRVDQPSTDDDEFVELRGTAGVALDGLTYVVIGDPGTGTIEAVIDLTGQTIGADGLFLIAEDDDTLGAPADLVVPLNFENNDNVTHLLVEGFTGSNGDDLDTDDDGLLDVLPWQTLIDAVGFFGDEAVDAEFAYGVTLGFEDVGPDEGFVPGLIFRCRFAGPWTIGDFDLGIDDTPGGENCSWWCAADITGDGVIDVLDLVELIVGWGQCDGLCPADINRDGAVDVTDLVEVIVGWGPC